MESGSTLEVVTMMRYINPRFTYCDPPLLHVVGYWPGYSMKREKVAGSHN